MSLIKTVITRIVEQSLYHKKNLKKAFLYVLQVIIKFDPRRLLKAKKPATEARH